MWGGTPFSSITALSLRNCPFLTTTLPFLSSRAKPRDLQFCGAFLEMFFLESAAERIVTLVRGNVFHRYS
jgi:hypothetical protein